MFENIEFFNEPSLVSHEIPSHGPGRWGALVKSLENMHKVPLNMTENYSWGLFWPKQYEF